MPRPPRRRIVPAVLLAVLATAPAAAGAGPVSPLPPANAPRTAEIAPGVSYERRVIPGGEVVHIIRAARSGRASFAPVMAGGSPTARGGLAQAVAGRTDQGVLAGVNGDFFNFNSGNPSGIVMVDGELINEPEATRSALVTLADGNIAAAVLALQGSYQAVDATGVALGPRVFSGINRSAERDSEVILYTPAYGQPTTPRGNSRYEALVQLDAPAALRPNEVRGGTVVSRQTGGGTPIAPGQVVLTGIGPSGATLWDDLAVGRRLALNAGLTPLPPGAVSALGGGPLLVVDGRPVTNTGEGLSSHQINSRTSRTAVAETGAGTLMLVAAEGPDQGSPGVTSAEQAALLAGLGARTAIGMDGGGSSQMVIGASPLVAWSSPRQIANAVVLRYSGVWLDPLPARVSANADRVDDDATTAIHSSVPGRARVVVTAPDGTRPRSLWASSLGPSSARIRIDPRRLRLPDGAYLVRAELTPADGSPPLVHQRRVVLDRTLGSLTARPSVRTAGKRRIPRLDVGFRLTRPARVTVEIRDGSDRVVKSLVRGRSLGAGLQRVSWNRRLGKAQANGRYRVVVQAKGRYGTSGLVRDVTLTPPPPPRRP